MKKILLSVGIIAIVAVGAIGVTRAYFSDTATVTGNTFTSGTMDLKIDANPDSEVYQWENGFANNYPAFSNLKPGDIGHQVIDIKSDGTVGGMATIDINRTSGWSDLAGKLIFTVDFDANHDGVFETTTLSGAVDAYTQAYDLGVITGADGIASVRINWSVPTSAGNEIQGDSVVINGVFGLNQVQ